MTTLFATPDFGAGGMIGCFLALVWAVMLLIVLIGLIGGLRALGSESRRIKSFGVGLILVSVVIPMGCCWGPSVLLRLSTGNYPLGRVPHNTIREGMSMEEVTDILGTPHERHDRDDGQGWYYYTDSFGLYWFRVTFDHDGRVKGTHSN